MKYCTYCGGVGHTSEHCPKVVLGQAQAALGNLRCGNCGSRVHNTAGCPSKRLGPNPIVVKR